jgi:hypothetical protein
LRNFGKGTANQLVFSGLTTDDVYDVYVASTQGNAEAGKGDWSTPNTTSTVGAQSVDSSATLNITTWERGNNFVLFENVVVDGNGKIVLNGQAAAGYRLPVNGFQLVPATAGGNDFATWIADPAFGLDPGVQGFANDPDGDHLGNGIEAFFGTDPSLFSAGVTQVSTTGAVTTFQHPEADPPLADVTGSYQWSLDLVNWNASGASASGTTVTIPDPPAPVAGITTVTATATGTIPAKLFLRVVATN